MLIAALLTSFQNVEPQKDPAPTSSSLRLELRLVRTDPKKMRLSMNVILSNRGNEKIRINPVMFSGELLKVRFYRKDGSVVRYVGDDILAYMRIEDESSFDLFRNNFFGIEVDYQFTGKHFPAYAVASSFLPEPGEGDRPRWSGILRSEKLLISAK